MDRPAEHSKHHVWLYRRRPTVKRVSTVPSFVELGGRRRRHGLRELAPGAPEQPRSMRSTALYWRVDGSRMHSHKQVQVHLQIWWVYARMHANFIILMGICMHTNFIIWCVYACMQTSSFGGHMHACKLHHFDGHMHACKLHHFDGYMHACKLHHALRLN